MVRGLSNLPIRSHTPIERKSQEFTHPYESHYNPSLKGRGGISATDKILRNFGLVDDSGKISVLGATGFALCFIGAYVAVTQYLHNQAKPHVGSDIPMCRYGESDGGIGKCIEIGDGVVNQLFMGCGDKKEGITAFHYDNGSDAIRTTNRSVFREFCGEAYDRAKMKGGRDEILEVKFPDVKELYESPLLLCDMSPGTCRDFGEEKVLLKGVGDKVKLSIGDNYSTMLELKGYSPGGSNKTAMVFIYKDNRPTITFGWPVGQEQRGNDFDIHVENIRIERYKDIERPLVRIAIKRHVEKSLYIPKI